MSNKINSKLGLRPSTRTRRATHARVLATSVRCPKCESRHCIRTQSENVDEEFMCGSCGYFFDLEAA